MPQMASEAELQALLNLDESGKPHRNLVEFFTDAVPNEERSEKEGHPCFDDKEFIKKMIPGDSTCNWIGQVTEQDKRNHPKEYAAFKAGLAAPLEGTPLTTIPFISKGQCLEMAARGIKTAEQLRDMSDGQGQNVMGFFGLRRKVAAYLEAAEKTAPAMKLQADLQKRDDEIEVLKQMIETLSQRVDEQKKGSIKHEKQ